MIAFPPAAGTYRTIYADPPWHEQGGGRIKRGADRHVRAEMRKALEWLRVHPERRKTPRGMPKFLVNWLNRAVDSRRGAVASTASIHGARPAPVSTPWCEHEPACHTQQEHTRKMLNEQRAQRGVEPL